MLRIKYYNIIYDTDSSSSSSCFAGNREKSLAPSPGDIMHLCFVGSVDSVWILAFLYWL